nr:unnamed protein product [Spirometra erinaceieuropaei]
MSEFQQDLPDAFLVHDFEGPRRVYECSVELRTGDKMLQIFKEGQSVCVSTAVDVDFMQPVLFWQHVADFYVVVDRPKRMLTEISTKGAQGGGADDGS